MSKPILCLDFDGVIHSYTSGWKGADVIPDPPVPGTIKFLADANAHFEVHIYSSRSGQPGGIDAMKAWLWMHAVGPADMGGGVVSPMWLREIQWPTEKPPALITIDDRALTFTGNWADFSMDVLKAFLPWNKRIDRIEAPMMAVPK